LRFVERERRGHNPGVYLVGALGVAKVLLFRRHNPDPDGPHWSLFVTERSPQRQERAAPAGSIRATKGRRTSRPSVWRWSMAPRIRFSPALPSGFCSRTRI
jgi:hypothetical protein